MPKRSILVVDDEQIMRESIREALRSSGYAVSVADDGATAKELLQKTDVQVVLTDMKMPGVSGVELLKFIKDVAPDTLVILMTAFGTIESAIEAMREGAFDYLTKPFSINALDVVLEKAFSHLAMVKENRYLKNALEEKFNPQHFVGEHPSMRNVFEVIRKVAHSKATVLVMGESGTGKELVARSIHCLSGRKHKPFIRVNCAALSTGLLESELFGHEKGSFTGAHVRKPGRFELADGGTLLLDEISEMDIALQSKLLRVLQEREFERVGGVESLDVDVRVIATTNRDLEQCVRAGKFREDLYYRLNVVPVTLPSLRDRMSDIPLLMDFFLQKYAQENAKRIVGFDEHVYALFKNYTWPGNVRELENVIERAVVLASGEWLLEEHFDIRTTNGLKGTPSPVRAQVVPLYDVEKECIFRALEHFKGNKTHAAEALGITVRTLRNKLDEYREEVVTV